MNYMNIFTLIGIGTTITVLVYAIFYIFREASAATWGNYVRPQNKHQRLGFALGLFAKIEGLPCDLDTVQRKFYAMPFEQQKVYLAFAVYETDFRENLSKTNPAKWVEVYSGADKVDKLRERFSEFGWKNGVVS